MNTQILDKDKKYYVSTPDKDFSVQRNMRIIQETIADTNKFFASEDSKIHNGLMERVHAMACYGVYKFGSKQGSKKIDEYLGKHTLIRFLGESILDKIKAYKTADHLKQIQDDRMHILL